MKLSNRHLPITRAAGKQKLQSTVVPCVSSPKSRKIKKDQDRVAQDAAFKELLLVRSSNGGQKKYGDIKAIVSKYQNRGFNVKRHHLEYRLELRVLGKKCHEKINLPTINVDNNNETVVSDLTDTSIVAEIVEEENNTEVGELTSRKGGRSKGSNKDKAIQKKSIDEALTKASELCLLAKKQSTSKLPNGTFAGIIKETEQQYGLEDGTINFETVRSRVLAKNPSAISHQKMSPLSNVEDIIVECCCRLSAMGEALTKTEVMSLADDIVADSIHVQNYVAFCKKRNINKDVSKGEVVGNRWYRNFINRHKDKIKCKPCRVQDRKRLTWCTHDNFFNMYESVYESMVEAGVAIKHPEEVWLDKNNQITINQEEAVGRKTRYQLVKPERCVYVDETGCNTNMKNDGHVGGRRYIMGVNQIEGGRTGVVSDIHFTVLAFTSGTGHAIMCAIIMKSEKNVADLPISWKLGIDITKEIETGETLLEVYDNNMQNGVSIGGPKCTYLGKTIPTFVCSSPNASITSELLAKMLCTIDEARVFERNDEVGIPFLLLDGHHSRTRLPFLNYINDPEHKWKVCIGVPYATHMWQPHDSSELNGTFKTQLYKVKEKYLREKPENQQRFVSTDIVPIVNKCWPSTLGNISFAKKSLYERGWTVLNYCLLDDPRLLDKPAECATVASIPNDNQQEIDGSIAETLNPVSQRYLSTLDKLIDDRLKSEGRKRKYEDIVSKTATKTQKIQHLEKMLNVSSGKLACNNIFCLDENVRDRMLVDENDKRQKQRELQERKTKQQEKQQQTFKYAAIKYFSGRTLLVTDIKSILKHTSVPTDSPMKNKVQELRDQLHRRRHRMNMYNLVANGGNGAIVAETDENEFRNENIFPNIFLPNSGQYPENGSVGTQCTVPLRDDSGTGTTRDFMEEDSCQGEKDFSEFRI
jgi:hypothetical protein